MTAALPPVTDAPIAPLGDAIPRRGSALSRWIGRRILRLMGWSFTGAFPDVSKAVMIGAPHTTNWDFVVALAAAFVQQMVDEFARRERFWLAIAPEGTRKAVTQWKTGFYHIATGAGVPIVLVFFDHRRRNLHIGPVFTPGGDLDADLARILQLFADRLGQPVLP
jgi:1-acyl-sn-glycerol-3-phosphate acyltransferase